MLDLTSESPDKSLSKRFALKKEMPILKQFRKIHKHYNQQTHPFLINRESKQQIANAQIEIERLTCSLQNLHNMKDENLEIINQQLVKEESILSPQSMSQHTQVEGILCKQDNFDIEKMYSLYIQQQFTEDKKQRCLEWLANS